MKWIERERATRLRRVVAIAAICSVLGALADVVVAGRVRPQTSGPNVPAVAVDDSIQRLKRRHLQMPIAGITLGDLHDAFAETRSGGRPHEALDIMAPRRTPVLAVDDGTIAKLFTSKPGGLTIYEFDPSSTFSYYYAHLDGYADGLIEGQSVRRGQVLGYVGSTGNASADAPHLHFAVFRLGPERQWWKGTAVNPYLAFSQ